MKTKKNGFLLLSIVMTLAMAFTVMAAPPVVGPVTINPAVPGVTDTVQVCADVTDVDGNLDTVDVTVDNGVDTNTYTMTWTSGNQYCKSLSAGTLNAVDGMTVDADVDAVDDAAESGTNSTSWTYDGQAPTADANGPYVCDEGTTVAIDATGSWDSVDTSLDYAWDLNWDGNYDDSNLISPDYTCLQDGVYQIGLQVTDDAGFTDTDSTFVTVNNVAPTADAGGPYTCAEGQTITLDASASSDPGVSDVLTFEWDLDTTVDSDGDGTANNDVDDTGETTPYTCADGLLNLYNIQVTVTDPSGDSDSDATTITILNLAPSVNAGPNMVVDEAELFSINPTFSDYVSDTHTATVDWGDATGVENLGAVTSPFNAPHTYLSNAVFPLTNGVYLVTVTVTDNELASNSDTMTVTVNNVAPDADAGGPYNAEVDIEICLDGTVTDVADTVFTYEWDLDYDGFSFDVDSTSEDPCTTYSSKGSFTVGFRGHDGDDWSTIDTTTVNVYDAVISLNAGWNLISIPLIPADTTIEAVLLDQLYDFMPGGTMYTVQSYQYDPINDENVWLKSRRTGYGDLDNVVPGYAYWVNVDSAVDLLLNGDKYQAFGLPPSVNLGSGWNLIGKYGMTEVMKIDEVDNLRYSEPDLRDLADYPVVEVDDTDLEQSTPLGLGDWLVPKEGYWTWMGGNGGQAIEYTISEADYTTESFT